MLFVEGSHVVHGAGCQGNHALCLYMSKPVASLETVRLSDARTQNEAGISSERCDYLLSTQRHLHVHSKFL